jgi:hypothetical protein
MMMIITDGRVVIGTMITMIATGTIMIMTGTMIAIEITKAGEA